MNKWCLGESLGKNQQHEREALCSKQGPLSSKFKKTLDPFEGQVPPGDAFVFIHMLIEHSAQLLTSLFIGQMYDPIWGHVEGD